MPELASSEIKALAKIIDELDYYQLLHLAPGASPRDVKLAYHSTSRNFHPDANRHLDDDLRRAVEHIAKQVSEAYCVLRDPRRRRAYDERLAGGDGNRMQLAEAARSGSQKSVEEREGRTPQGRQYYHLAQADLARDDVRGAIRNLQTALTFEPGNEGFKELVAELRARLD